MTFRSTSTRTIVEKVQFHNSEFKSRHDPNPISGYPPHEDIFFMHLALQLRHRPFQKVSLRGVRYSYASNGVDKSTPSAPIPVYPNSCWIHEAYSDSGSV